MHIKQVVIEGYRSYREQFATEPFSSKVNCVVGANGSGKTNFFYAIRFLLSDHLQNLRSDERKKLLHEGAGNRVSSSFVEIVFDNSDNRIPVDKEEVRLRRMFSEKKDEYFLDGKHITKTEVMNLLESAGFSRSNPYYVVQQGKITSLTTMKDNERLDLFKEIGGTRVYEERRRESIKIMQETGNKRKQIIQVVKYLEDRLRELDEEKEELKKYQQLDKQRKSLEYNIYDKEVKDAEHKLNVLEESRNNINRASTEMYENVLLAHEQVKDLEKIYKDLKKEILALNNNKASLEKVRTVAIKKHTELELDSKDLQEKILGNVRVKEDAMKQLARLQKEIDDSKEELDKITPFYKNHVSEEENITKEIMEREKQLSILYQKQGRATQFSSKSARDRWLQKEIDDLEQVFSSNKVQEGKLQREIDQLNAEIKGHDDYIENRKSEIAELEALISGSGEGVNYIKLQRDKLQDQRKSLWGKENELSAEIDKLKAEVVKAQKSLDGATAGDIRRGLGSVRNICKLNNIKGVYGPIIELLDCEEKFFTAVEVTAGNSLFHVVVETDDVSTQIIRDLNSMKGGRVTFIPLNRVRAPRVTYPKSPDLTPLLKNLKFSPNYSEAFAQVFGRTLVCRNLDVATRVARAEGFDCITMEGDQVSKKGGMTGGFYDYRRSKLKFMYIIKKNTLSINEKEGDLKRVKVDLQSIDQQITNLVTEQQKIGAEQGHHRSGIEQMKREISSANKQKESVRKAIDKKEKLLANVGMQIDQLQVSMQMKRTEMGTELIDHLTPEEKQLLTRLNPEITSLKEKLLACKANRVEAETRKEELESNLKNNLIRRKYELEQVIVSSDVGILNDDTEMKKQELMDSKISVDDATQKLKRVSEEINEKNKLLKKNEEEKNKLKTLEDNYEKTLEQEAKQRDQILSQINALVTKKDEFSKKIKELSQLSSDAFEMYKKKSVKELQKMLHKCNEQLQQFSHVNKKALDQYVNFTEQRDELQKRQAEMDAGDEKISELINILDQRKDESIERTFKGVARHFREVFSELVQGGHGFLVMMRKKDSDHDDGDDPEDDAEQQTEEGRVEKYVGVKVKVSFTGQGETQSMKQLSGGQKTVVALTLIFAIQRCDPAPFYLFDEIDAALDSQYRTSVGNMIRRLADTANTQFIITTFRAELVKVADKIYGVTHRNRVSYVNVVSKEEALNFIDHDTN